MKINYYYAGMIVSMFALGGCFGVFGRSDSSSMQLEALKDKQNILPVAVIGSGPAGLMAGVYGARGGKTTFIFEGNKPGGLLMDTTEVANWPGDIMITGPNIINKLRDQAAHHGAIFIQDTIEQIDTSSWPYKLTSENGDTYFAMSIIVATGASPARLGVKGEETYWGAGVTSCAVCDAPFYKNMDVVVIGGGDSAVEEAIQLSPFASKITILVRKGAMRAAPSMQARLKNYPKVSVKYDVQVKEVLGDGQEVTGVLLESSSTGKQETFPCKGVFLAIGHIPNTGFVKGTIDTDDKGYINTVGKTQATSIAGIFAAGDVEDSRYRQAGSSAGFGIAAGLDAVRFLDEIGFSPSAAAAVEAQIYNTNAPTRRVIEREVQKVAHLESLQDLQKLMDTKPGVVVMDFWSETCPSCKQMLPAFSQVAEQYGQVASFRTIDADEAPDIASKYSVQKLPCVLVFKDGAIVGRYADPMSKKEMSELVERYIENQA